MKTLNETYFDQIYRIMEEAFPLDERRSYEGQKALFKRKDYHIVGMVEQEEVMAFLAYYEQEDYCFVEHLATHASTRGSGIGRVLLETFLSQCKRCVVLEVEPPVNAIARRRIGFYERLGFHVYPDIYYEQPALQATANPIQLFIMSSELLDTTCVEHYCRKLHKDIYRI